ncbi:hypothetical protein ACWT_4104 [Actinoplanes sp. SE50]|nr:hypothetical protein ACPL_4233 [Actinoplanes sp. SE50/110]ATO83519.1 hypothetical protein ACWT_4104 [Actinoplanes sp. SE50]SLM00926.1 hypothetical protein ACSP50_4159 [Actinoplanes sp. SE50/110]
MESLPQLRCRVRRPRHPLLIGDGPGQAGLHPGGECVVLQARGARRWNLVSTTQGYYRVVDGRVRATSANPVRLSDRVLGDLGLR